MDEVALDDRCPVPTRLKEDNSDSPELPWCVLCNNDAVARCLDCGGDLYCSACSTEVHRHFDADHRIIPFKKPSTPQ